MGGVEAFKPADFLARLLQHVPEPHLHQVRYYRRYSNVARAQRAAAWLELQTPASSVSSSDAELTAAERRRLRMLWARLIRRVHEVDPVLCHECAGTMRILAFALEPSAVRKILVHLEGKAGIPRRAPLSNLPRLESQPANGHWKHSSAA